MLSNVSSSEAPPLKRPAGLAFLTTPAARAPLGIALLPSTSTGWLTVAAKFWPGELILEPTGSSRTTLITVSAGTTMGLGRGASALGASALGVEESEDGADEFASVADCWSAGFWQPPSKKREPKAHRDKAARLRFIHNLQWEWAIKDYYERRTNQCTGAESHTVVIFCCTVGGRTKRS